MAIISTSLSLWGDITPVKCKTYFLLWIMTHTTLQEVAILVILKYIIDLATFSIMTLIKKCG